ncbi:hypothetical protein ACEPPN_017961 [Leptodophora sp. 'Broadleaf-Isolate-01']
MSIVSNTFAIEMARHGFGKHLYSLRNGAMKAIFLRCIYPSSFSLKNRTFLTNHTAVYIGENIYVAVLGLVKISILTFYLRIFQLQIPFRIAVYTTIVFIVLGSASISFSTIFQCRPIAYFWDKDLHGKCLDVNALAYANSGLSIVQDFLIIGLPIRVVWNMNLDRKKKWSVAFMFALGGLYLTSFLVPPCPIATCFDADGKSKSVDASSPSYASNPSSYSAPPSTPHGITSP